MITIPLVVSPTAVECCRHRYPVAVLICRRINYGSQPESLYARSSFQLPAMESFSWAKPIETTTTAHTQAIFFHNLFYDAAS